MNPQKAQTTNEEAILPHFFIKNNLTAKFWPFEGEVSVSPSCTVPDQTMDLRTILTRYANGIPVEGFPVVYEGEDGIGIDPRTLDLSERETLSQQFQDELNDITTKLQTPITSPPPPPPPITEE